MRQMRTSVHVVLLVIFASIAVACGDAPVDPGSTDAMQALKPRKNGGWLNDCVGITYYGNTTPNMNNVPDGANVAWSYQNGYTYIQTCLPQTVADWPEDVCSERATDWMSICQIQLPMLGDPLPGGWALMPGSGGGQASGNGGTFGGTLTDSELYCPNGSPNCLLALRVDATHNDRAKMDSALARVDTTRAICKEAYDAVKAISQHWYRGNPLIPDRPGLPHLDDHQAQSRRGARPILHVDEDYLNSSSLKELAELLLHEGWHLSPNNNPTHGENEGPIYTTSPFSQAQSCVPN